MVSCIFTRTTSISRVRIGTTLTVACPWDERRLLSVVVNQSLRVEKNYFLKGLDGRTTTHRVSEGTMVWELLDDWMIRLVMMISFNGGVVGMHDTISDIGIGHGGAQRFRQQQPDIPRQWTCSA